MFRVISYVYMLRNLFHRFIFSWVKSSNFDMNPSNGRSLHGMHIYLNRLWFILGHSGVRLYTRIIDSINPVSNSNRPSFNACWIAYNFVSMSHCISIHLAPVRCLFMSVFMCSQLLYKFTYKDNRFHHFTLQIESFIRSNVGLILNSRINESSILNYESYPASLDSWDISLNYCYLF